MALILFLFSDMLSRTEAQSYLFGRLRNYLTSKEPSDDALSASLYADYSPFLESSSSLLPEPEKLEEEQRQQSKQISPLICRTICAFLCTKGWNLPYIVSPSCLFIYHASSRTLALALKSLVWSRFHVLIPSSLRARHFALPYSSHGVSYVTFHNLVLENRTRTYL